MKFVRKIQFTTDKYVHSISFMILMIFILAKCMIPCMNDGKCINPNKCRCPHGFGGDHCEIDNRQKTTSKCKKPCQHGICMPNHQCRCNDGWSGRFCNKRGNIKHFYLIPNNLI